MIERFPLHEGCYRFRETGFPSRQEEEEIAGQIKDHYRAYIRELVTTTIPQISLHNTKPFTEAEIDQLTEYCLDFLVGYSFPFRALYPAETVQHIMDGLDLKTIHRPRVKWMFLYDRNSRGRLEEQTTITVNLWQMRRRKEDEWVVAAHDRTGQEVRQIFTHPSNVMRLAGVEEGSHELIRRPPLSGARRRIVRMSRNVDATNISTRELSLRIISPHERRANYLKAQYARRYIDWPMIPMELRLAPVFLHQQDQILSKGIQYYLFSLLLRIVRSF